MGLPNAVHHLAIATADMKAQIEFYTQVVGMELVALYWMHGVEGTFHAFLQLGDKSSIAFAQGPGMDEIRPRMGVSHAEWTAGPVAPGAMQHLALNVDSEAELLAIRDRVRAHGHWVFGPIDHGFCKSIYLKAPEGVMLEFSTWCGELDAEAWIDPEVVRLCGIDETELKKYKNPPAFASRGGNVANPAVDRDDPPMAFPAPLAGRIFDMSDEEVASEMSETEPPVKVRR